MLCIRNGLVHDAVTEEARVADILVENGKIAAMGEDVYKRQDRDRLDYIPGMVPNMFELPEGCYFAPRCKYCQEVCLHKKPEMKEIGPGHMAACHFPLIKDKNDRKEA